MCPFVAKVCRPHCVCSEASLRTHKKLNYAAEKLEVIPNGFDLEQVKPDPAARESLRAELGLAS